MALHNSIRSSMSCHNLFIILLALLFIVHTASASNSTATTNSLKTNKKFIQDECKSTTYPKDCCKSLSPYAPKIQTNPVTLTKICIYVALKAARTAKSTLAKLSNLKGLTHSESEVIADCQENVDNTVGLLEQSADAMAHLNGTSTSEDRFQWDNIKTWMSAAITDETTCTDEFYELKVRTSLQKKIKPVVAAVARMTSNALALVNRLNF